MNFRFAPVVKRYASVLLETCDGEAAARGLALDWETLQRTIERDPQGWRLSASPLLSKSQKQDVFSALGEKLCLSYLMRRLLYVLIQNGRLSLLEDIVSYFSELWGEQKGFCNVYIQTPHSLSAQEKQGIKQMFADLFNKKVGIVPEVKPELLGGVILSWGQRRLDASVATQLQLLCQQLQLEG